MEDIYRITVSSHFFHTPFPCSSAYASFPAFYPFLVPSPPLVSSDVSSLLVYLHSLSFSSSVTSLSSFFLEYFTFSSATLAYSVFSCLSPLSRVINCYSWSTQPLGQVTIILDTNWTGKRGRGTERDWRCLFVCVCVWERWITNMSSCHCHCVFVFSTDVCVLQQPHLWQFEEKKRKCAVDLSMEQRTCLSWLNIKHFVAHFNISVPTLHFPLLSPCFCVDFLVFSCFIK